MSDTLWKDELGCRREFSSSQRVDLPVPGVPQMRMLGCIFFLFGGSEKRHISK